MEKYTTHKYSDWNWSFNENYGLYIVQNYLLSRKGLIQPIQNSDLDTTIYLIKLYHSVDFSS